MKKIDWVLFISIPLILLFGLTLYTIYFLPIYPDEITIRYGLSRMFYDFPKIAAGSPQCPSSFLPQLPKIMYFPGLIDWLIHGNLKTIVALRQVGCVIAFLWVGGLGIYLYTRVRNGFYVTGFMISIFSIGVFPFFVIVNRNEQLILPCTILLIGIFIASDQLKHKAQLWQKIILIFLYFSAVSLILFAHPKGLFLTPLFIIVAWKLFTNFKLLPIFFFTLALLCLQIFQTISFFKHNFSCSELPQYEALLKSFSINLLSLFQDPHAFFSSVFESIMKFHRYLSQISFQVKSDVIYLPPVPRTLPVLVINFFIKLNFICIFFTLMILLPYKYYRENFVRGQIITINFALLILFWLVFMGAVINLPKNWYDAGYFYAMLLIILIFFLGENYSGMFRKPVGRNIFLYLGVVALLSQSLLIKKNLWAFMDGYTGLGISIATYNPSKTQHDLEAASHACNINPVHSKNLIVDDYTYLYFQKSKWPLSFTYIGFIKFEKNSKSFLDFIAKADSDGLIVNCEQAFLPIMSRIKREGDICCLSKEDLKLL